MPAFTDTPITGKTIYTDPEGALGSVTFEWFVNDVSVRAQVVSDVASGAVEQDTLADTFFARGDTVKLVVTGSDGQ
ncbi:MAG: hypothetical protein HYT80_10955, partial [Euryarchaeota archaeon]|nr:hypothetical protein [Euryarchaeota archaeon]